MTRPSLNASEFEYDASDPPGYRSGVINVGQLAGARANSVKLYEVPAGEHLCPYHYEYEEEWLLVLAGTVQLRAPAGVETLAAGAVVCFPVGPEGAHKITGTGTEPARVLMFSSAREPSVAVYPDSDKIGVWAGTDADQLMLRRADGQVDYWDGEA